MPLTTAAAAVGVIATTLSCGVQPRQTWHVLKSQNDPAERAALTVPGMVILLSIGVLWTGYGWAIGAYASSLLAAVEALCQLIMLAVLARHRDVRGWHWALGLLPALCVVAVAVGGASSWVGAFAAGASMAMFAAPAYEQFKHRHDTTTGYAGGAVALIICANVLWTLYGILHGSIWLTLPSAIHTVFGLFMAWAKGRRSLFNRTNLHEHCLDEGTHKYPHHTTVFLVS